MAAKTAGTWRVYNEIGIQNDLTVVDTTAQYTLGRRVFARDIGTTNYGRGEFIYLKGVASTVRGSVVVYTGDFTTTLTVAKVKGPVAVALAAVDAATKFGWYQILGQGVAVSATVAANAQCYACATAGAVDDAAVTGDFITGMVTVSADDTSTCVVLMGTNPSLTDADNV